MLTKIIHDTLVPEEKDYHWENGECSICGYNSVYSEGEEHYCETWNTVRNKTISNIPLFKEKIIEELIKQVNTLWVFKEQDLVGSMYSDEKMRGENVEHCSWIKKEDLLELINLFKN